MIVIKNKQAIQKMHQAGMRLAEIFEIIETKLAVGMTTLDIEKLVEVELKKRELISRSKGYMGYKHITCISIDDEVVHGIPSVNRILQDGNIVSIDICVSLKGYCADMARSFIIGKGSQEAIRLIAVAKSALDKGIAKAIPGNRLSDISNAIQQEVEAAGFNVVRDFAGHGIGKQLHEDPEVVNFGEAGKGPILRVGMTLAIEPMITQGRYEVFVDKDGWTVKTKDKSLAAHVEDTVAITESGPMILTRFGS
ncbi:MAG: Methionine aminopeptidase [candidate division TM6 bacterium GW2011_GWF2_32_72]|nr:MAG: Methionine aminopeptidase [candidate division TM6 bacterium GW2011_GWF2_32_72]